MSTGYVPGPTMQLAITHLEWVGVAGYQGPEAPLLREAATVMRQGRKPEGASLQAAIRCLKYDAEKSINLCYVNRHPRCAHLHRRQRERGAALLRVVARLEA